jgi:hypothetical protein
VRSVGALDRARRPSTVDVREAARDQGFTLEERPLRGQWVWEWRCHDDTRWPFYLSEREALSWMADQLRRAVVFLWSPTRSISGNIRGREGSMPDLIRGSRRDVTVSDLPRSVRWCMVLMGFAHVGGWIVVTR